MGSCFLSINKNNGDRFVQGTVILVTMPNPQVAVRAAQGTTGKQFMHARKASQST